MHWPWEFQDLAPDERHARRLVLDRYGHYGFLLSVSPAVVMLVVRLLQWTAGHLRAYARDYRLVPGSPGAAYSSSFQPPATPTTAASAAAASLQDTPNSPSLKKRRMTAQGLWAARVRRVQWWLSDSVVLFGGQTWGRRDEWLVGAAYLAVLLVLCTVETGRDYLHVTKRLGIVGMSQLPLQYVLAMRHVNPLLRLFRTSHEQINRWHRTLGALVYLLVALHSALYLLFFALTPAPSGGSFWSRLLRPVVVLGLAALACMTALSTTALSFVRRWSYRLFFITHVTVAFVLPAIVFFHASHAQYYVAAALLLLIADIVLRKLHTVTTRARIEAIPGSSHLVRLVAPIPGDKMDLFRRYPARHVFVSLPHSARPSTSFLSVGGYWLFEALFNPFTLALVGDKSDDVTLVVRARDGPMSAALTRHATPGVWPAASTVFDADAADDDDNDDDDDDEATPAISTRADTTTTSTSSPGSIDVNLEGPYGTTAYFPPLRTPHAFDRVLLVAGGVGATFAVPLYRAICAASAIKVELVWSVRGAGDAAWAVAPGGGTEHSLLDDEHVHIYTTGGSSSNNSNSIEMTSPQNNLGRQPARHRPDLRRIVDDVFRHGNEERVAVVVCGPEAMVQELRRAVGAWVHKGREVWWHNESFGW